MEIRQDIKIGLTHKLVVSQELRQALKILELPNTDLNKMIEEELILNPALEKDEKNNEFETNQNKDSILEKDSTERNDIESDYGLNDEYFISYSRFNRKYMSSADDKKSNF